jgi:Cation transporter/ATPase, N-terminus
MMGVVPLSKDRTSRPLPDAATLLARLETEKNGLTSAQAAERLARYGRNLLKDRRLSWFGVLGNQLKSPLLPDRGRRASGGGV